MADLRPAAAAWRNSDRRVRRTILATIGLYREAFAPFGAAPRKNAAAADGFHTGAKSVPTLAHDIAGLKGSLQCLISDKSPAPGQSSGVNGCACSGRARLIRIWQDKVNAGGADRQIYPKFVTGLSQPHELLRQSHSRRIVNIQVRTPGVARRVAYVQAANRLIKYPWCNGSD